MPRQLNHVTPNVIAKTVSAQAGKQVNDVCRAAYHETSFRERTSARPLHMTHSLKHSRNG